MAGMPHLNSYLTVAAVQCYSSKQLKGVNNYVTTIWRDYNSNSNIFGDVRSEYAAQTNKANY